MGGFPVAPGTTPEIMESAADFQDFTEYLTRRKVHLCRQVAGGSLKVRAEQLGGKSCATGASKSCRCMVPKLYPFFQCRRPLDCAATGWEASVCLESGVQSLHVPSPHCVAPHRLCSCPL